MVEKEEDDDNAGMETCKGRCSMAWVQGYFAVWQDAHWIERSNKTSANLYQSQLVNQSVVQNLQRNLKVEAVQDRCRVSSAFVLFLAPNGKLFTYDNEVFRGKKVTDESMGSLPRIGPC